jgi:methionine-rich copper-binding protein CopC
VLRFNSRIEHSLSRVSILDPSGRRMPLREIVSPAPDRLTVPVPGLAPGTYTLEWQVLSVDGHITRGSFPFRVAPAP